MTNNHITKYDDATIPKGKIQVTTKTGSTKWIGIKEDVPLSKLQKKLEELGYTFLDHNQEAQGTNADGKQGTARTEKPELKDDQTKRHTEDTEGISVGDLFRWRSTTWVTAFPFLVLVLGIGHLGMFIFGSGTISPSFGYIVGAMISLAAICLSLYFTVKGKVYFHWHSLAAFVFTAVVGIILLFTLMSIAEVIASDRRVGVGTGRTRIWSLIFEGYGLAIKNAFDPSSTNFWALWASMTFGVGIPEEFIKTLPIMVVVWYKLKKGEVFSDWKIMNIAFFSGLGFGVTEAFYNYAPWSGNVFTGAQINRWMAAVPMHAIYTVVDAALLLVLVRRFKPESLQQWILCLLSAVLLMAFLHGTFNAFSAYSLFVGLVLDGLAVMVAATIWASALVFKDAPVLRVYGLETLLTTTQRWKPRLAIGLLGLPTVVLFSLSTTFQSSQGHGLIGGTDAYTSQANFGSGTTSREVLTPFFMPYPGSSVEKFMIIQNNLGVPVFVRSMTAENRRYGQRYNFGSFWVPPEGVRVDGTNSQWIFAPGEELYITLGNGSRLSYYVP